MNYNVKHGDLADTIDVIRVCITNAARKANKAGEKETVDKLILYLQFRYRGGNRSAASVTV